MTKTKSQLISIEELIKLFINDRKEGKKKFVTWFLNEVMNEELIEQLNADAYERTGERTGYRNGCKRRSGFVQKRRFGIEPIYIYFSSFSHSFLSVWKEFFFLSLIL